MNTAIAELVGIKYPIFQGGMALISDANLASAVSNAGGLGIIAAANAPADYVRKQIRKCRQMTDKPFGVNIMLLSPYVEEVAEVVAVERVPVVTTGAGSPQRFMSYWKDAGIKVIPVIPSSALALRMQNAGADAVVAEGCESGGHIGELTTMTLVPQVVDTVKIPVIAAGGIADARGVKAAFALGASGVQCGTIFLASSECNIHENYKNAIIEANDTSTVVTGRSIGLAVRGIKNDLTRQLLTMEKANMSAEEIEGKAIGALKSAAIDGDRNNGALMCGQIAGLIKQVLSCEKIIHNLFK